MNDIRIHKESLISIKSIDSDLDGQIHLSNIIQNLFSITGYLYVEASRPNCPMTDIIDLVKGLKTNSIDWYLDDFCLMFSLTDSDHIISRTLSKTWFAYEHCIICFFTQKPLRLKKRIPWHEITAGNKSFVMFRGPEEDVVWIGKSYDFDFDFEKINITGLPIIRL